MDHDDEQPLLGNGYYLDLANRSGLILLCRDDGAEVARFSVWDATGEAIERAAREDRRRERQE